MSVRPRVLVCDADPQSLRALRVVLRGAGFDVDETSTANAALDHSALRAPDGAIIELVVPDGDGVQGQQVHLAPIEFKLLRTHIANLRSKLEPTHGPPLIGTQHGVGYRAA
jgi:DNA-binding response OmpR family regulator